MELKKLVSDYREHFVGKTCQVSTNYKDLAQLIVTFQATDLHHLFGLHKLTSDYASQTLEQIESGIFCLEKFSKLPNFREVKQRVELYPFIADVFIRQATEYCLIRKDLSRNTMNLDLVFFEGNRRHVTVLGLRKSKEGYYRLITLHRSLAQKYNKVRKTKITGIKWL
ncbi:hypothetical protein FRX57_02715 [Streptococcus cuniculipharyngis]|uniref:Phage-Barnase-EndoU-ColicinE5/D-RelE like nuclease 4 domain-containing protein n=1 Tax=Streptococcus cuniculipharyngis TaxID=1562651 RepID=A0A5C5SH59_9STRE|nr:hypothetical protein FRX57_02715 [Streptococcus cuniculipharyngis]